MQAGHEDHTTSNLTGRIGKDKKHQDHQASSEQNIEIDNAIDIDFPYSPVVTRTERERERYIYIYILCMYVVMISNVIKCNAMRYNVNYFNVI